MKPAKITAKGFDRRFENGEDIYEPMFVNDIYRKLEHGEQSIKAGKTMDALESLHKIREEFGL